MGLPKIDPADPASRYGMDITFECGGERVWEIWAHGPSALGDWFEADTTGVLPCAAVAITENRRNLSYKTTYDDFCVVSDNANRVAKINVLLDPNDYLPVQAVITVWFKAA